MGQLQSSLPLGLNVLTFLQGMEQKYETVSFCLKVNGSKALGLRRQEEPWSLSRLACVISNDIRV